MIELLITLAVLSSVVTMVILSYEGVKEGARYDAARFEMAELRKALLQFRRDSGSEAFPGQGQYDCRDNANGNPNDINPTVDLQLPTEAGSNDAEKIAWCEHPANFWMLFADPLGNGWDKDTHRGWRGPYISRTDGYVAIDADIEPEGILAAESNTVIEDVWGIASPYLLDEDDAAGDLVWQTFIGSDILSAYGTPYLMFDLDKDDQARIVSLGEDHAYDEQDAPDCEQELINDVLVDHVLCLLK